MQIVVWVIFAWVAISIMLMVTISSAVRQSESWESKRDQLTIQWARQQKKDKRNRLRGD